MTLSTQVPATMIGAWFLWSWQRLGQTGVPESRRRLRRASIVLMLVVLPVLVRALAARRSPAAADEARKP